MKDEVSQLAKKVEELTAVPKESLVKHSALEKFKAESEAISYSASLLVVDIDKDHYQDQTFIGAYAADIFAYLKRLEVLCSSYPYLCINVGTYMYITSYNTHLLAAPRNSQT